MATTATATTQLSKGAKVVARSELRDVPEGTAGRVQLVNGLSWIRYWVRFDNGVSLGSVDRSVLATKDEWKRLQAGEDVFGEEAAEAEAEAAGEGGAVEADSGGGKTTPSGTFVPQKFIDRAAAARQRLQG